MMILDSGLFFGPPCILHSTHSIQLKLIQSYVRYVSR